MVLTRGDLEILDPVGEEQSWDDHDAPALPDDVAFTSGDWLGLLKPAGGPSIRSWRTWKRLSGMVAVISGIALVVVTFSSGGPIVESSVNLETAALASEPLDDATNGLDPAASTLPLTLEAEAIPNLLSSSEAAFLGLIAPSDDSTSSNTSSTSTTLATTTTLGWAQLPIPPESEWVDSGNGVAVPEVLLRIRYCESTNDYTAAHAVSSARGAYQFLTRSWEWYGHAARYGVARADLATPAQQDEAAVLTVKQDGTRPWLASRSCWGSNNLPAGYASIRPPARSTTTSTVATTTSSSGGTQSTAVSSTSTVASTVTSTTATTVSTTATTATTTPTSASSSTPDSTAASTSSSDSTSPTTSTG